MAAPPVPQITGIVDDGNGTSVTVTILVSGAVYVLLEYRRDDTTSNWSLGNYRTGSGTVVQTGLTSGRRYEFIAVTITDDGDSLPSRPKFVNVTGGAALATISEALSYELRNTAAIQVLISTRIYPAGGVPTSADKPWVTWQRIDAEHVDYQGDESSLSGQAGLCATRVQIDCWAMSLLDADDVFQAIRTAFNGFAGEMGTPGDSVTVALMTLETERTDWVAPIDATERAPHRVSSDWLIWHEE